MYICTCSGRTKEVKLNKPFCVNVLLHKCLLEWVKLRLLLTNHHTHNLMLFEFPAPDFWDPLPLPLLCFESKWLKSKSQQPEQKIKSVKVTLTPPIFVLEAFNYLWNSCQILDQMNPSEAPKFKKLQTLYILIQIGKSICKKFDFGLSPLDTRLGK